MCNFPNTLSPRTVINCFILVNETVRGRILKLEEMRKMPIVVRFYCPLPLLNSLLLLTFLVRFQQQSDSIS